MARFLVVDDDPVVRHILGAIIESLGHELIAFSEGEPALEFLTTARAENKPPILAFLDFQLAEMTGIELLLRIRGTFDATTLPVAMLSANSREEVFNVDATVSPDYFIPKPFTLDDVQQLLIEIGI